MLQDVKVVFTLIVDPTPTQEKIGHSRNSGEPRLGKDCKRSWIFAH
jgi:hypothetical protein